MSRSVSQPASIGEDASIAGRRLGKYVVADKLGRGGMGVVYEAVDTILHRRVALKVLLPSIASDAAALQRFVCEARAAARLNHPNVVAVYDCAQHEDLHFIVMELVRGGNLQDELKRSGRLTWPKATAVIVDACRGLAAAHRAGLVHRDIKPSNLLRTADGAVKLADFGLSKSALASGLTAADVVVGTPDYMSPEQCRGEMADPQSDVYALGATYFALLTGRAPYEHPSALRVLYAHCSQPVPDPQSLVPDLPESCSAVVRRAMAKEPSDRYASSAELLQALERLLEESANPLRPAAAEAPAETLAMHAADTPRSLDRVTLRLRELGLLSPRRRMLTALAFGTAIVLVALIMVCLNTGTPSSQTASGTAGETPSKGVPTLQNPIRRPAANPPAKPGGSKTSAVPDAGKLAQAAPSANVVTPTDAAGPFLLAGMTAGAKREKILIKRRIAKVGLAATAVAFSPEGDRLAVAEYRPSAGSDVHVWNAQGRKVAVRHLNQVVTGMAFQPGADALAIGCSRGEGVVLWNPSNETAATFPVATSLSTAGAIAFSSDGAWLAYAMNPEKQNGVVELWDVAEHRRLFTLGRHRGAVTGVCFAAKGAGETMLASSDAQGQIILWNAVAGKHIRTWNAAGPVAALSLSSDGRKLVAATNRGVEVWDTAHVDDPPLRPASLVAAAHQVAFLAGTQQVVWTAGQEVHVIRSDDQKRELGSAGAPLTIGPTDGLPMGMAAAPTQWLAAVVSRDGVLSLWEFPRHEPWVK